MNVRKLGAALLAASVVFVVAGCGDDKKTGGTSNQPAASSLTIWVDDKRGPAMKTAAARFGQENGVTVKVEVVSKDLQTNFVTASQANKGPDLVLGAHDWIGNLVQNGSIDPVQMTDQVKSLFNPIAIKGVTYNGQIYGVPLAVENVVLFRNTDLAPTPPNTIEEMVAAGKALKASGKTSEIFALPVGQTGDPYHIYPLYTSAGGYLFGVGANGDYDPKDLGVGKPGAVTAFEKIAALGEKGQGALKRSITGDNLLSLFTTKKVAFMISGPWQLAELKKASIKWDISPVPGFAGAQPAKPFVGVQALYVASKGKNKAIAQEFATNFFPQTDVAVALYQADPRPPALLSALEQVQATEPNMAKVLDAGKGGDIMPAIPAMATVWDPLGKAEAAIIGGAAVPSTVAAAAKNIQSQIK
jgi:arabinogalactan oligomer/maltooligosaccharide transport system substrate-binding protein